MHIRDSTSTDRENVETTEGMATLVEAVVDSKMVSEDIPSELP